MNLVVRLVTFFGSEPQGAFWEAWLSRTPSKPKPFKPEERKKELPTPSSGLFDSAQDSRFYLGSSPIDNRRESHFFSMGITVNCTVSWPPSLTLTALPADSCSFMKSGSWYEPGSISSHPKILYSPGRTPQIVK